MRNESYLGFNTEPLKYFRAYGKLWSCDGIFNWKAIDPDGSVWLYKTRPHRRLNHWSAWSNLGMLLAPSFNTKIKEEPLWFYTLTKLETSCA